MLTGQSSFDNLSNLGFIVNPNIQDSALRSMTLREQKAQGMYYWANSDTDPAALQKAQDIFGRGMIPITDKDNAAYYAGLSQLQDMGFSATPFSYFYYNNIPIPENIETDEDVYMYVGQKMIDRHRSLKAATDKATDDLNELGDELPGAIATAVRGDDLNVSRTFNPELREKLMELQEWDGVEQSLKRAQTAWLYMASYMGSPEDLRAATREDLRHIADSLKDHTGNIDERAMAAFQIAVESRAKEMQSWDSNFWKNVGFGLEDTSERWADYFTRPDEPNADEERLYGTLLSAINTSVQAADGTSSINKTLASFGYLTGEMAPSVIASSSAALAATPAGLVAGAIAAAATTSATTYIPTANQAISSAYLQSKENPELHGHIEGAAEAAVEGLAGTIPGGIIAGKLAGKAIGKAASLAAGSRLLSNTVTQTTLRFFGGATLQGLGELAEEEASAALSSGLNAAFRAAGYSLTPEQYNFGKAWGEMPSHQVAAIFCYTSALGIFGLPANIKAAREYARSSDNLLMVGHSEAAARDITEKQYQADAEKENILTSDLPAAEKADKLAAIDARMDAYRVAKYRTDVLEASPEEIERRKKRENDDFMLATEAMLYIQNGVAERALERANITASIPAAGNKVTFLLENKNPETGEVTMEERTVTKKQFANWLMTERNKELRQSMRNFQSQLTAKKLIGSVQSSDDIKHEIINLHDAPAKLITELKNHEAITITTLELLANHAKNEIANLRAQGMSEQQALMQSSTLFKGVQLQHVANLVNASQERQENEAATTAGAVSGITTDTKIEHPAFRLPRMDGTSVIVYAEGRAGVNHIIEELLESHLAQQLASGTTNINTLAEQLKTIEKQLPGKIKLLPKGKQSYSFGDIVEAYSKIAQANFLYNEAYLPLDKGGHRLVQNILRNVQAARIYKVLGEAYKNFANSEKGKAYLANGGKSLVDIMNAAGFTLGSRFQTIQQEADKAVAEMEARNLLPSPKQEAKKLIEAAKDQQELAKINAKESEESILVPAEESITGEQEELPTNDALTENPQEPRPELTEEEKQFQHLLEPGATVRAFAIYLSQHRGQVALINSSTITQSGEPNPAFVQGELLSRHVPKDELVAMSDAEMEERLKIAMVDEAIFDAAGSYTNSERIKIDLSAAKKELKDAKIEEDLKRNKAEQMASGAEGKKGILPPAPKWTGISEARQAKQTEQEQSEGIAKAIKGTVDKGNRIHNAYIKHEVKNGRERWITAASSRVTIVSRISDKEPFENLISAKTGEETSLKNTNFKPGTFGSNFPNVDRAIPASYTHRASIDLAPYRALRKYKKKENVLDIPGVKQSLVIYQPTEQYKDYKPIMLGSLFFRDAVEQLSALAKVLDFGSEVHVDYINDNTPIVFSAEHNGWEWKHIMMPIQRPDKETRPGDIELSDKPAFIGATEYNELQKFAADKELKEAEAKTQAAREKLRTMEQRYRDVAQLEQELPEAERHARWFAAQLRHYVGTFHRKRVSDILNKNLTDTLVETLTFAHTQNKYTGQLFTRLTGIKLPGTIKGNEQAIKEWAPKEYAEYMNREKSTNQDNGSFSITPEEKKAMAEKWAAEQAAKGTPIKDDSLNNQDSGTFSVQEANEEARAALSLESEPDAKAEKVKESLKRLKDTELRCINAPNIVATVNTRQRGKIVSPAAMNKSIDNGFTMNQHLAAASKIDELYKFAIPLGEYDDMNKDPNVKAIFRFACPVKVDNQTAFALLTLKRTEGDKLYSLELEEINQLGGTLDRLKHLLKEEPSTIPLRAAEGIVAELAAKVKEYFGENALPSVTATEASNLFNKDGVLQTKNAIITKPGATFSIFALHASPHNFRKFTTDKMGSGEGAQAYGWGLYFAEDAGVNKHYYRKFANTDARHKALLSLLDKYKNAEFDFYFSGVAGSINTQTSSFRKAFFSFVETGAAINAKLKSAEVFLKKAQRDHERSLYDMDDDDYIAPEYAVEEGNELRHAKEKVAFLKEILEILAKTGATNYRVELNVDDSQLLHFDQYVSEDFVERFIAANPDLSDLAKQKLRTKPYDRLPTGDDFYSYLTFGLGSKKAASERLAANGIKGIKYLDGNSRDKGKGSYNYVIFSGDDIKITHVNETGIWSMEEGWQEYTDPTATFSIAAADNLEQRFAGNPLAERMSFYLHREAKRFARILGNKTPHDTAVNAIASANAVISMLDKYVHTNKIPLGRNERAHLGLLQRLIEKYAHIIKVGGARSFNKISKAEQGVLDNILAEISTGIEEGQTKANAKERYQELVRQAAKGRVWALLSKMMDEAGDILDSHLKSELIKKMQRITKGVKIKRTPSKRLKGKMTAAGYRDLEQAVTLMAMSQRAKQDTEEAIDNALRYLINNVGEPIETLRNGTELLAELADRIERNGQTVTEENLNQQLTYYSNAVQIFGDIESKDYRQTKAAAAALFMLVNYHRTKWQEVQEAKTAHIKAHLQYFLDNTTPEMGRDNTIRQIAEKEKGALTFLPDSMMNTAQLFLALASFKGLQPLFNEIRYSLANAQTAREVHLRNIREQELAAFGQIIGIKPATKAGYTKRQLNKISDALDLFYQDNNQTHETDIVVKWMKTNSEGVLEQHEETLKATNWELLGLILNYRQPHYKINAELHGFTQDVLDKIETHIGEKLMAFGNAIQQIIVNDGTMQVYEEREGIPMRDEPLYFPGSININTLNTTREEPLAHAYHPAAMHDFLHVRVRHRNEIKATNAYTAYRSAIADRANYIYLDPATETLTRLLAHNDFSNRLLTLIGPNLFSRLRSTISEIKGAGYQETSMQDISGKLLAGALAAKSIQALSGNIPSHIRQLSAVANAGLMPGISPLDILKYINLGRSGKGKISITAVLKLSAFETRRRDNAFVNEMASMDNNVKYSRLLSWAKTGLNTMDKLDVLANAVSATIVYNHKYDQLRKMGHLSEEEIRERCEQEVNTYVRLLAQPLNKVDKSALYWTVSNWAIGRALLFMSSEAINKLGMLRANYIIKRNQGHNPITAATTVLAAMGMSVGLASFITESIIAGLTGNTPDDDDSLTAWAIATYLNATIGQYLDTMPIVGSFSRQIFSPYAKLGKDTLTIPGSEIPKSGGKLWKMLTDDIDYSGAEWQKQITRFMREFSSALGYLGGAYSRWQLYSHASAVLHSMTAVLNTVYFVAQAATNKAEWTSVLPDAYTKADPGKTKSGRKKKERKQERMKSAIEEWLTPDPEKKGKKSHSGKTSKQTEISTLLLL